MKKETIIHVGPFVACDVCNEDFTNRTDTGGVLWGSYAVCPDCVKDDAFKVAKRIKATCPPGMQFRHWVISLRKGDNSIRIISESK